MEQSPTYIKLVEENQVKQFTKEQAINFLEDRKYLSMSPEEIVLFQLKQEHLCVHQYMFYECLKISLSRNCISPTLSYNEIIIKLQQKLNMDKVVTYLGSLKDKGYEIEFKKFNDNEVFVNDDNLNSDQYKEIEIGMRKLGFEETRIEFVYSNQN